MTAPTTAPVTPPRVVGAPSPDRRWVMLGLLVVGIFMALVDATIVNVALPSIRSDLHASGAALELVVSGYTISYAMLLITGARLGDLLGARRMFLSGLLVFAVASLACGLAPTTGLLIAARFVQGAGAAAMVPQILSVIQQQFQGVERTRALSVYGATIAAGAVCGQVLGGVLVNADLFGTAWRPAFLVNVPVAAVLLVLVPRYVPSAHVPRGRRLDLPGLLTATAGVLLVVLPLVLGREEGWPLWTWASLVVGTALLVAFTLIERRVAARGGDPLLDPSVVTAPGVRSGLFALAAGMLAYGGFIFSLSLHLQVGLGQSALRAGLTFVPAAATFGALGYFWSRFPRRWHAMMPVVGLVVAAVSYALLGLTLRGGGHSLAALVPILLLAGCGMGISFSPLMTQSLVRVPVARAADASGLLATSFQLSQVIGVAAFGGLYLSIADDSTSGHAVAAVDLGIAIVTLLGALSAYAVARTIRAARTE